MLFKMLACDYDGTLASHGVMSLPTEQALLAAKQAGLRLCLITGREFDDLLSVCSQIQLFDLVIAENGVVLYLPATAEITDLASPIPAEFSTVLERHGVPYSQGRIIASVDRSYTNAVQATIQELGLSLEVIFNKDAAMILPSGTDKASGLQIGIQHFGITADQVIGVGDAENDLAFLQMAGFHVALANALDSVKAEADLVTSQPNGAGVAEFIHEYLLTGLLPSKTSS